MTVGTHTSPFTRRLSGRHLIGLDILAAVGFGLIAVTNLVRSSAAPPAMPALIGLAVAICLPVAVRRPWPLTAFAIVLVATGASVLLGGHNDWFAAAGFCLYIVAVTRPPPRRVSTTAIAVATVIAMPCLMTVGVSGPIGDTTSTFLIGLVVLGAAWTVGNAVRDRRIAAAEAARRLADQEVAEERLHIARELHDVVAHSLSLIAVKAQVANHVGVKRPEAATEALVHIESTAKSSLAQMRGILGVLRSGPAIEPVGGLADLSDLTETAHQAGVSVTVTPVPVDGIPTGIALAGRRIIQEAVTNVIKHAAPTTCQVIMQRTPEHLELLITDCGPGANTRPTAWAPSTGNGLRGMAERVAAFDGRFTAAPTDTGFEVRAVLPLGSDAP